MGRRLSVSLVGLYRNKLSKVAHCSISLYSLRFFVGFEFVLCEEGGMFLRVLFTFIDFLPIFDMAHDPFRCLFAINIPSKRLYKIILRISSVSHVYISRDIPIR
jgi:hypothetical protein